MDYRGEKWKENHSYHWTCTKINSNVQPVLEDSSSLYSPVPSGSTFGGWCGLEYRYALLADLQVDKDCWEGYKLKIRIQRVEPGQELEIWYTHGCWNEIKQKYSNGVRLSRSKHGDTMYEQVLGFDSVPGPSASAVLEAIRMRETTALAAFDELKETHRKEIVKLTEDLTVRRNQDNTRVLIESLIAFVMVGLIGFLFGLTVADYGTEALKPKEETQEDKKEDSEAEEEDTQENKDKDA